MMSGMKLSHSLLTPVESTNTAPCVELRHIVYALTDALDLVGIDDVGHGKRVGVMAFSCAEKLGFTEEERVFLFDLGMLHDIGVSSTVVHNHLVTEFDWTSSQVHCEIGYALLRDFAPLAAMALPIRYHHTHWDELQTLTQIDAKTAMYANLIFMVDRVDALAAPYYSNGLLLVNIHHIRDQIKAYSGTYFAPLLVEAFLAVSSAEAFWLQLEARNLQIIQREILEKAKPAFASIAELKAIGWIFAHIVDAKSPFTAEHSIGVAKLSRLIAERMGVQAENCDKIEIAGLLHDLGKLRIPDEVLDKPNSLDDRERVVMNTHSFETFQILRQIEGFGEIAEWAACHHEELAGDGYPFHIKASELPLEARILRVADIFQAMAQNRPYRKGLSAEAILAFLNELVAAGRIEAEIVASFSGEMALAMNAALSIA